MIEQFDFSKLEGKIKELYDTQDNFAKAIPLSRSSLNRKLHCKIQFTSNDIYRIVCLLNIEKENIGEYFFAKKV